MSKKLPLAVFISSLIVIFLLGVGYAFGIRFITNPVENKTLSLLTQPVTSLPISLNFNLSSPEDNSLVFDPNLLVQGKTSPNTYIAITLNEDDQIIDNTSKENFSATLKLQKGINLLSVTAFDAQGNKKTENRTIYFSNEGI